MTDVFLSYAREDRKRIQKIARALTNEGFEVYIDPKTAKDGEWSAATRRELVNAAAIVACWSEDAVQSTWVVAEASHGQDRRALVSVNLEECRLPSQFNRNDAIDLSSWRGKDEDPDWGRVVQRVRHLVNVQKGLADEPVFAPSVQVLTPRAVQQANANAQAAQGAQAAQSAQVVAPSAFFSNSLGTPRGRGPGAPAPAPTARAPEPVALRTPEPRREPPPARPAPQPEPLRTTSRSEPPPRPEQRPEQRPAPRPEQRPAPQSESLRERERERVAAAAAAPAPQQEIPRLLRTEERPPEPAADFEEPRAPRRGGAMVGILGGGVAAVAALVVGFLVIDGQQNGALRASLASKLSSASSAPAPTPDLATPPVELAASAPPIEEMPAEEIRPRLEPAAEAPATTPAPAAAAPAPAARLPAPLQTAAATPQSTPGPAARTPAQGAPAQATPAARAPGQRNPALTPQRTPKLVIPAAGAAGAPASASAAGASPAVDVVNRMERCLAQLVNYCPRGVGNRGGFAEDGSMSGAERRFMNQRSLFGWSEVTEANVANCQRHVAAAASAGETRSYQPLVTACASLPIAGPDR